MRLPVLAVATCLSCAIHETPPSGPVATATPTGALEPSRAPPSRPLILFVRIPRTEIPTVRGKGYDELIDHFMQQRKAGKVTGSGGGVDGEDHDYVGIDVEVTDVTLALPLLRQKLRQLRVPKKTVIIEGRGPGGMMEFGLTGPTTTHPVW